MGYTTHYRYYNSHSRTLHTHKKLQLDVGLPRHSLVFRERLSLIEVRTAA